MDNREMKNTMTRTIDSGSPIWIPILVNIIFILVCCSVYIYNLPVEDITATLQGGGMVLRRLAPPAS